MTGDRYHHLCTRHHFLQVMTDGHVTSGRGAVHLLGVPSHKKITVGISTWRGDEMIAMVWVEGGLVILIS